MEWLSKLGSGLADTIASPAGYAGIGIALSKALDAVLALRGRHLDASAKAREQEAAERRIALEDREMTFEQMKVIVLTLREQMKDTLERLEAEHTQRLKAEERVLALRNELHDLRAWLQHAQIDVPAILARARTGTVQLPGQASPNPGAA